MDSERQFNFTELEKTQDLPTYYFEGVKKKIHELAPDSEELLTQIIQEIDKQGFENFTVFESNGATFPVISVDINQIIDRVKKNEQATQFSEVRTILINPGFAPPPAGHPFTPWDMVYDRVFREIPKITNAAQRGEPVPHIQIKIMGSANSLWGGVKPEWVEKIRQNGLKAHGEAVAQFVNQEWAKAGELPQHLMIHGISMGSVIATETAKFLDPNILAHTQLLLDNPADHEYKNRFLRAFRALQLPLGLGLEAARMFLNNPEIKDVIAREPKFLNQASRKLIDKGIHPKLDKAEMALKTEASKLEIGAMLHQLPADENVRSFIRGGTSDLVTLQLGDILRQNLHQYIRQSGRRLHFLVRGGHQKQNLRIHAWERNSKLLK